MMYYESTMEFYAAWPAHGCIGSLLYNSPRFASPYWSITTEEWKNVYISNATTKSLTPLHSACLCYRPGDRCALNLSRKHQPKPNLHTEVRRNGTEVLETCTDEYQTLVQGLIKGCREWYRPRKRGESIRQVVQSHTEPHAAFVHCAKLCAALCSFCFPIHCVHKPYI
jgi:hypothetical protein